MPTSPDHATVADQTSVDETSQAPILVAPFKKQLTFRSLIIGALGSALVTTSSIYVALKLGALPWPIVFAALLSLVCLKALGNTNLQEVTVAHTALSAGSMVAGAVAFTIPGLWILDKSASFSWGLLLCVVLCGVALGLIFSALARKRYLDDRDLPYPVGTAAAMTLKATKATHAEAGVLAGSLSFAAFVTVLRDGLHLLSRMLVAPFTIAGVPLALYVSPMMMSIGFMAGTIAMVVWIIGALIGHLGILAAGISTGVLSPELAESMRSSLGIGLMIGSGVGVLIKAGFAEVKDLLARTNLVNGASQCAGVEGEAASAITATSATTPVTKPPLGFTKLDVLAQPQAGFGAAELSRPGEPAVHPLINHKFVALALAVLVLLITLFLQVNILLSAVAVAGTWVAVNMAAQSVGETSIDPLEIFAVIVLLLVRALTDIGGVPAFFLVCMVACACGLAGDCMADFKSGKLLAAHPKAQWYGEVAGSLIGAFISVGVLYLLVGAYGTDVFGTGKEFIAVQATVVSSLIAGVGHTGAFWCGIVVGVVLYLVGLPVITLGLGVYLPLYFTITASVGLIVKLIVPRKYAQRYGLIIASGFLGGEAVVGVLLALVTLFGFLTS